VPNGSWFFFGEVIMRIYCTIILPQKHQSALYVYKRVKARQGRNNGNIGNSMHSGTCMMGLRTDY